MRRQWVCASGHVPSRSPCGAARFCASGSANAAGDQTYTITATGQSTQGLAGIAFTINQSNSRATTVTGSTLMAEKGYASNTGCWVLKKPSQC